MHLGIVMVVQVLLAPASAPSAPEPVAYGGALLRMLAALVVVCVLAYVLLRYGLRRLVAPAGRSQHLRVLERCPLATGKALWIVAVGPRTFLVGSAEQGLSLLAELQEGDLPAIAPTPPRRGFNEVLAQVLRRPAAAQEVELAPDEAEQPAEQGKRR